MKIFGGLYRLAWQRPTTCSVAILFLIISSAALVNAIPFELEEDFRPTTSTFSNVETRREQVLNHVFGSTTTNSTSMGDDGECLCRPPCLPLSSNTFCPWNRTVDRTSECPCCDHRVCARQTGQSCNHDVLACDRELGLTCDNDTNTCSGPYNLRAIEVSHNTSILRWRSALPGVVDTNLTLLVSKHLVGNETVWDAINATLEDSEVKVEDLLPRTLYYFRLTDGSHNSEVLILKTADGCLEKNGTSYGLGETFTIGCEQKCVCRDDGATRCEPRCSVPEPRMNCPIGPDPHDECCTIRMCDESADGHSLVAGEPQVIVTGRTPDSLTVAWDDFKVPGPNFDHGYVVEYRPANDGTAQVMPWTRIPVENAPFTTIRSLKPNTAYEVRVFIWEDMESKKYGPSTEIMVLSTKDGCLWDDKSFTVGENYYKRCDANCTCLGNNTSECGSRCIGMYKPKGSAANDSHCTEEPSDEDACCVVVRCTSKEDDVTVTHNSERGFATTLTSGGECPRRIPISDGMCNSDCSSDADCPNGHKCCLSDCGSTLCIPPSAKFTLAKPMLTTTSSPCSESNCGPNTECRDAICLCIPGFSGNPYDEQMGCVPVHSPKQKSKAGCTFGNATYLMGETFYNGCEFKCECNNKDGRYEIACQPRCPMKEEKFRDFDPSCSLKPDPKDECCKVLVCETYQRDNAHEDDQLVKNETQFEEGCEYKGKMYGVEEHFYDGCESSCLCLGLGEIDCNPRCPTTPEVKPGCVVVPHPADNECCTVVICNPLNLNFTIPTSSREADVNKSTAFVASGEADSLLSEHDNHTVEPLALDKNNSTADNSSMFESNTTGSESSDLTTETGNVFNSTQFDDREYITSSTAGDDVTTNETMSRSGGEMLFNETVDDGMFNDEENETSEDSTTESGNGTFANSTVDSQNASDDAVVNSTDVVGGHLNASSLNDDSNTSRSVLDGRIDHVFSNATEASNSLEENGTTSTDFAANRQKEMRQLENDNSTAIEFPKHEGRMAAIYKIVVINPTTVRMQILLAAPIMEKMFMDNEAIAVLFTTNLTDLIHWHRHPLSLLHNVGFVSVDRSDVAVETIIGDLQPNRQYNFVVIRQKEGSDPDLGMMFEQLSDIEATVTIQLGEGMCEFMGKSFHIGERIYEECQAVCDCFPGQIVHCEAIVCPNQISPEKSGCLEWNVDTSFIPRAPLCCPEATCKYGSMCVYKGRKFRNLEKIPQSLVGECDQECTCHVAGNVTCVPRCQPVPALPPPDMECQFPELMLIPGDECCKHWHCKELGSETSVVTAGDLMFTTVETNGEEENVTTNDSTLHESTTNRTIVAEADLQLAQLECIYGNSTYKLNEQWRDGKGHRQKLCSCILMPNGTATHECQGGCPPILKQHMDLIPDCPPENVVIWDVPELCPYALCNKTEIGRGIKNVSVETLNATAIRVNFVIPNIYVGLYGHIEILYTMDLSHSEDTTTWSKEVFSGQSNQFENVRLSHEMTGLQPDTQYSLKVLAIIKNTKNMDSSEIITIQMPPLPTTTTTTTTTTLPPKISIDVKLNVTDVQITSATIVWRNLEQSERRFIDGLHLQYKLHRDESQQWSKTMMIHRDVTSFLLDHLKPDSDYDVEIVMVPPTNVTTEIFSGMPIMFRTLPIHDDFEFNLTLTIDKVTTYTIELIWTGVPYPEHKYINVYKFLYRQMQKGVTDSEPSFIYRPPKGNQFQFTVERLAPETNYSVWMEAILSNGKIRHSNVINVTTKQGPIAPVTSEKEKLEANIESNTRNAGNAYYAALIVVAVIAALCALGFVILLIILLKKQSSAKAPITSSKSHTAYDNPTYKTYDSELVESNGKSHHHT